MYRSTHGSAVDLHVHVLNLVCCMIAQIRIAWDRSWIFSLSRSMLHQGQTGCFGRRTVRASCCKRNIFEKPSGKWEIGILGCFGMILNWGCMEGLFWRENADLFYAIPVSGRLSTRRSSFHNFHTRWMPYYVLIGQLASWRVRRI